MRRPLLLAAALTALLLFPAAAIAKGPSAASISGPGLGHPVNIEGYGEGGSDTALGILVTDGGFFSQAFGGTPSATTSRPGLRLGPRYEVTYTVPGPNGDSTLRQDLYPYGIKGPVTYMAPAQKFWGTQSAPGGWYQGTEALRRTLIEAGLPSRRPGNKPRAQAKIGIAVGAGAGITLAAGALALLRRQRRRSISA
ncbi:MAG: hypothetical protein V7645_645 [Actinomycetota bacterium]|jgi:hypothetical protein